MDPTHEFEGTAQWGEGRDWSVLAHVNSIDGRRFLRVESDDLEPDQAEGLPEAIAAAAAEWCRSRNHQPADPRETSNEGASL